MFSRSTAKMRSISAGTLNVDAVDDVEELLHHGHLLVDELDFSLRVLEKQQN